MNCVLFTSANYALLGVDETVRRVCCLVCWHGAFPALHRTLCYQQTIFDSQ